MENHIPSYNATPCHATPTSCHATLTSCHATQLFSYHTTLANLVTKSLQLGSSGQNLCSGPSMALFYISLLSGFEIQITIQRSSGWTFNCSVPPSSQDTIVFEEEQRRPKFCCNPSRKRLRTWQLECWIQKVTKLFSFLLLLLL